MGKQRIILCLALAACTPVPVPRATETPAPELSVTPAPTSTPTPVPTATPAPVPPVPEVVERLLRPEVCALLGQSRREIRSQSRMEASENDTAFWYSALGYHMDGSQGNVFVSYNLDGMTYDGLCDYISGEIERITPFPAGTTFSELEEALNLQPVSDDGWMTQYIVGDWEIYAEREVEDGDIIRRITVKSSW